MAVNNHLTFGSNPELVVCCGDTLSHLGSKVEVENFIANIVKVLDKNGKVILSFRDYSNELKGVDRFIPVRSDDTKILTCFLEFGDELVHVTDLLHEKIGDGWKQRVSTYQKVRLSENEVVGQLEANGMIVKFNRVVNRLTTIIASKG